MSVAFDHLVVGAASLDQGVNWVRETFGVEIPRGGEHANMGTHNCVMQIGRAAYLEVIATNPDAPTPDHPRWFGLDDPAVRSVMERQPSLLTWVVNTKDISTLLKQTEFSFGSVEAMSRDDLKWLITIPPGGNVLENGVIPMLIQWQVNEHPASKMAELGCTLEKIEIHHPQPDKIAIVLEQIGASGLVQTRPLPANSPPYLAAHLVTPLGRRTLTGKTV